jgi:predicted GIY-YIG superfamily endonuclease
VTVRYVEYHASRSAAQSREYEIKSLSRTAKEELISSPDQQIPISVRHD